MRNIVVICDDCPGKNECPAENKERRVSCPIELYSKYYEQEEPMAKNTAQDRMQIKMKQEISKEKIIAECDWAIQKITDYGYTTMTSRKFFQDVKELLEDREKQIHRKYDDE